MARRRAWGRGECGGGGGGEREAWREGREVGVRGEVTAPESILVMDIGAGTRRPGPCSAGAGRKAGRGWGRGGGGDGKGTAG